MATFALEIVHGPGWEDACDIREQAGWDEHAAFMDDLVATGVILLGGPVGDQQQTLHVAVAPDEHDLRRLLAADPWARSGLLEVGTIRPWALWLDFRRSGTSPPPDDASRTCDAGPAGRADSVLVQDIGDTRLKT